MSRSLHIKSPYHYSTFLYGILQDPCNRRDWLYVGDENFDITPRHADHRFHPCSGGTILSEFVKSQDTTIQKSSIAGLVRGEARAKILSGKGTNAELFSDLDASDEIEKIASGYDSMQSPQHRHPKVFGGYDTHKLS